MLCILHLQPHATLKDINIESEKYDGSTASSNQRHIIESFTKADGAVRVVVATVAFGMGLDSPNVSSVVHWGVPHDMDMYVQETGRGRRDGNLSNAVLYYNRQSSCSTSMREYLNNTSRCRCSLIMSESINRPTITMSPVL